jgi:hypothetical protein
LKVIGGFLHSKCGGLGIIEDGEGKAKVCVECMGSGLIEVETTEEYPEIYEVRRWSK